LREPGKPLEGERLPGYRLRTADLPRRTRKSSTGVGSEYDVRVEYRDQPVEVTAA
jgi:hypothetical protein